MRSASSLVLLAACCALSGGSSCGPRATPPLGEVLVIVDTDALVPQLVSRLRVDAFTSDRTWYSSNEFELAEPDQWPTSFGVYSPAAGKSATVLLRLRAYPDGMTRDYRGERYQARPTGGTPSALVPTPAPPPGESPRLIDSTGQDITPPLEPQPLVTIDRLVVLETPTDSVESATVVLRGACFGTMADLSLVETCVDTENTLVSAEATAPLSTDLGMSASLLGSFGATTPCTVTPNPGHAGPDGTPLYDEEVCVPGGAFVFGSPVEYGMDQYDGVPERVAIVEPFLMDRYEVTVARWREAYRGGLVKDTPLVNDGPLATAEETALGDLSFCTYSDSPLGREDYAVNCLTFEQAEEFCKAVGSGLPFEVDWEYADAQVGRTYKTPYPWGGDENVAPTCSQAVFGRAYDSTTGQDLPCISDGVGPVPVEKKDGDVSIGPGIEKLAGGIAEWMQDSSDSLGSNCWMQQPLHMPTCADPSQPNSIRGANWSSYPDALYYGYRTAVPGNAADTGVGLRCTRPGREATTRTRRP
jgi:formylglycine-generating enzyme required for sulfatase activity